MDTFLLNISSFPTAIYSTALVVVVGYWFMVMLGLFDFDMFDLDIDVDTDVSQLGGIVGLLVTLGLTGVPVTLVISLLVLNSWLICYFMSLLLPEFPDLISLLQLAIELGIAIVSFLIAIPLTAVMIKPTKGLFKTINREPVSKSLIGRTCKIRSSRVDKAFGEAECLHHGASLIVKVRTHGKNDTYKAGDTAVIIEHQVDRTYQIVSEKEFNQQLE